MNKIDLSKIDLIINDSLLIIYNSEYGMVYSDSFVDENGMKMNRYNGDIVGRIMEDRGLIKKNGQFYELKTKGIEIVESGGYLKHRHVEKGEIDSHQITKTLNFNGNNYGNVGQDSRFENIPMNIQTNEIPNKKTETKSRLKTILSNPWLIGIVLVFIAAVLNGKRVMNLINNILEKF
jgi:hypothetical protein